MIANTPKPPYYAVIFTSQRTSIDDGYTEMSGKMENLAKLQDGFLGIESAREHVGISISYWNSLEDIIKWKNNVEHAFAAEKGKEQWYQNYKVRICKIEKDYAFEK